MSIKRRLTVVGGRRRGLSSWRILCGHSIGAEIKIERATYTQLVADNFGNVTLEIAVNGFDIYV